MAAVRSKPLLGTENFASAYDPTPGPLDYEPLPLEAIRDLLGIARALYLVRLEHGASAVELRQIKNAGRALFDALEIAKTCRRGSKVYGGAWTEAERGARLIGELIGADTSDTSLVEAGVNRVRPRGKRRG